MHPVRVRIHHWYVPNRIVWPESEGGGWESFITGGKDGSDTQTVPQVNSVSDAVKRISEYLGAPKGTGTYQVNALPVRAYNLIYNQRYRDQDLITERTLNDNGPLPVVAWEKDYLTTARPWSAKGPSVTLPVGSRAPVATARGSGGNVSVRSDALSANQLLNASTPTLQVSPNAGVAGDELYADLTSAEAININDFRAAFSLQRYQEARARYGSRFTEYLRYLGITPSDARLQEPEYLGGGTARLNFSEVLQTAPNNPGTDQNGIGDLYGHGIAGVRSNAFRKFFEEHGYVITLMSVRPKAIYSNGIDRDWIKQTKEDYFQRELSNLGQQEVYASEVFASAANHTKVFGYQDRYDEYRQVRSQVSQDFRDTLNSWHLARELTEGVTLNNSFVNCVPSKRIFQVQSTNPLWIMANHSVVARRLVPKRANPRII